MKEGCQLGKMILTPMKICEYIFLLSFLLKVDYFDNPTLNRPSLLRNMMMPTSCCGEALLQKEQKSWSEVLGRWKELNTAMAEENFLRLQKIWESGGGECSRRTVMLNHRWHWPSPSGSVSSKQMCLWFTHWWWQQYAVGKLFKQGREILMGRWILTKVELFFREECTTLCRSVLYKP